jgi:hypothetical protein
MTEQRLSIAKLESKHAQRKTQAQERLLECQELQV